jgi:hypothetical protein
LTERGKDAIKKEGIEKVFKLSANLSITNMVCFDPSGKIKKYSTPEQILDDFYDVRLAYYQKRKVSSLNISQKKLVSCLTITVSSKSPLFHSLNLGISRERSDVDVRTIIEPSEICTDDHREEAYCQQPKES